MGVLECWIRSFVASQALQRLLQYFNPKPRTRNSKRFNFDTPILHRSATPLL